MTSNDCSYRPSEEALHNIKISCMPIERIFQPSVLENSSLIAIPEEVLWMKLIYVILLGFLIILILRNDYRIYKLEKRGKKNGNI